MWTLIRFLHLTAAAVWVGLHVALFLFDEESESLRCRFATGAESDGINKMMMRSGQGLSGWVEHRTLSATTYTPPRSRLAAR